MTPLVLQLTRALTRRRLPSTPETALHTAIAEILTGMQTTFEREVRLSEEDRIDFVLAGELGLEVKVDGSLSDVTRQLHRYAQHARLSALVLVTTRMRHAAIPREINGKRVDFIHLIGSAL